MINGYKLLNQEYKKMKKIILGSALAFAALTLTSCLHDNEDLFEKPAAERMEEAVKADKELLESATNGWQMHYYTGQNYTGGGYTMFMKFKNGKASVSSDIAPGSMVTTSSYDVTKDQGPVLTFNTYNTIMHYLCQPYQSDVDGEQGDYEFVITRTTQDSIFVTGKKWGNKFVMTRVPADQSWKESINKMQSVLYSMPFNFAKEGASAENDSIVLDPSVRRLYVGHDREVGTPFYMTTEGIGFMEPVSIGGKEVTELKYDSANESLASADGSLKLAKNNPAGYHSLAEFMGTWNMTFKDYNSSTGKYVDNTQAFTLSAMSDLIEQPSFSYLYGQFQIGNYQFAVRFAYSPVTGNLTLPAQYIADPTGQYPALLLAACNVTDDGYVRPIYAAPFNIQPDKDGNMKVVCSVGECDSIVLIAVNSSGELVSLFYIWEDVSDFVSAQ